MECNHPELDLISHFLSLIIHNFDENKDSSSETFLLNGNVKNQHKNTFISILKYF